MIPVVAVTETTKEDAEVAFRVEVLRDVPCDGDLGLVDLGLVDRDHVDQVRGNRVHENQQDWRSSYID